MEMTEAATAFDALGHPRRLQVFRLLVQAGPSGIAAGEIARALNIPPPSLTPHLQTLQRASLIVARRDGRSVIYVVDFQGLKGLLAFLLDECCQGLESCAPSTVESCRA